MEPEPFLAVAQELIAIPSTADRPDELSRALELVLDLVGPGFVVERFESNGKPSALVRLHFHAVRPASFGPCVEGRFCSQ